jgi:hypothetical protein
MDRRGDGGMHPAAQAAQPAIQRIGALDDELTVLLRRWSGDSLARDCRARWRRHLQPEPSMRAAVSQGHGVSGHGVSGRAGGCAGPQARATPRAAAEMDRPPVPHVSRQVSITGTAATAADRPHASWNAA